jgi:hypothetical protein
MGYLERDHTRRCSNSLGTWELKLSRYTELITKLQAGETVSYVEHGNSMKPKLQNGVTVTVEPCKLEDLRVGDITLCKVRGTFYLHYVKKIGQDGRVLIGNAHGWENGWTRAVFGKLQSYVNPT